MERSPDGDKCQVRYLGPNEVLQPSSSSSSPVLYPATSFTSTASLIRFPGKRPLSILKEAPLERRQDEQVGEGKDAEDESIRAEVLAPENEQFKVT